MTVRRHGAVSDIFGIASGLRTTTLRGRAASVGENLVGYVMFDVLHLRGVVDLVGFDGHGKRLPAMTGGETYGSFLARPGESNCGEEYFAPARWSIRCGMGEASRSRPHLHVRPTAVDLFFAKRHRKSSTVTRHGLCHHTPHNRSLRPLSAEVVRVRSSSTRIPHQVTHHTSTDPPARGIDYLRGRRVERGWAGLKRNTRTRWN